jgi:putative FmdB family regulatory protein
MPTYDYECENGHRFEAFQSMKDEPLQQCVQCGAKAKRLIGPGAGFLFRGDGFYITDYRSKSYKEKAKSESGTTAKEPSSAKKEGGKAETPKKSNDTSSSS